LPILTKRSLRAAAKGVALRLPFGVGRLLRDYQRLRADQARMHARLRQQRRDDTVLYWQLVAAAAGKTPEELGIEDSSTVPEPGPIPRATLVGLLRHQGRFLARLRAGDPVEVPVAELVRALLDADDERSARMLSYGLQRDPATRPAGSLGLAIIGDRKELPELVWACLREVPREVWRRLAVREFFASGFRVDRAAALGQARAIVDDRPAELTRKGWLDLVKVAFGAGELAIADRALRIADELAAATPAEWESTDIARDWLRHWVERALRPAAPATVPEHHVSIAVLDYKQPELKYTSTNLGDYVQTLACLGHLARHQNLSFHGPSELVELVAEMQKRVRWDRQLDTPARDVTLVVSNRDASSLDAIPEGTWTIAFGWYMHRMFERLDFPLNRSLRPIFISFHCNRPRMLTPEAVAYLRRYAPIGCRDWTTVDLLLSAGVPAFFSGCITTTVDTVFPALDPEERAPADAPVAYVDVPTRPGITVQRQERPRVRRAGLVTNLRHAIELMESYRRRHSAVVTSRLHCYLPVRSLGTPVEFAPKNPADVRFNGLTGLTDSGYDAMRQGILSKLDRVLHAILDGKDEQEVYEAWRSVCAPDVARARARRETLPPMPPPSFDLTEVCARIRANQVVIEPVAPVSDRPELQVALALDRNLRSQLPVVVEALSRQTTRPLHLWVLCRDHGPDDYRRLGRLFPTVRFTWLPCDLVDYGDLPSMLKHVTVSTMDRLLLPELLPELDRLIYHDIDALPLADLGPLFDWDLQGQALAARSSISGRASSGVVNMLDSTKRLRTDPEAAHDCIRRTCARHSGDYPAFNAGVLVLDLARMRKDGFCQEFIPFAERYGMNDQQVLNCYAGPNRAFLPPEWNAFPTQEVVVEPKIIHWAGPAKPWDDGCVIFGEKWNEYARSVRDREHELALDGSGT
jgi:lipopolysaccharide biosynthesis glycosyltransferase